MRKKAISAVVAAVCTLSLPTLAFASTSQSGHGSHTVQQRSTPQYVTVQHGNTLYGLAIQHHTSIRNLTQLNHIRSNQVLHIGQRLIVGWSTPTSSYPIFPKTLSSRSESFNSNLSDATFGETVAKFATQFQGVPYSWGGESPRGFDCSGLVQFTFRHFGIDTERTSYSQFRQGQSVSISNLLPGDLVFYDTNGPGASHVGIYIGNGHFIHAGGRSVSIANMNNTYWRTHFVGAKRVTGSL